MSSFSEWIRNLGNRARDSWNREMGIQPGGGFTRQDFGNLVQSLLTGGMTGVSGRFYDFNTRKPMQGFVPQMPNFSNPFQGLFGRGATGTNQFGPTLGGYGGQSPPPGAIPYPQFTNWGDLPQHQGPPENPNYDQIHQGPPQVGVPPMPQQNNIRSARIVPRNDYLSRGNFLTEEENNFRLLDEMHNMPRQR